MAKGRSDDAWLDFVDDAGKENKQAAKKPAKPKTNTLAKAKKSKRKDITAKERQANYRAQNKRITVDIPDDLSAAVRLKAAEEGIPVTKVAREILQLWLNDNLAIEAPIPTSDSTTRLDVAVTKDTSRDIRVKAARENASVTEVIRSAFKLWLDGKLSL